MCCNEVEATRACLESVLRHTRAPFELVLVDNGSTDATPAYLEEVARRPGPTRVVVLRNPENRGYPAGCNQGLAAARGRYLVLLHNDTVLTPGWLDGLVGCAIHDWPRVGLVGPVSGGARPPQLVSCGAADPRALDAFATRRRQQFASQALTADRLGGFCLLLLREVYDRVGGLDERYGVGFFEDDDLCLRVRDAGLRLLVVLDVFVRHEGSRTFRGRGVDTRTAIEKNFAVFQAKWGTERAAAYRLPAPAAPPAAVPAAPAFPVPAGTRTTLCLIVRNEEANVGDCLRGVLDLFDEVIVQDTGSTDRTREIAAAFGPRVRVFESAWADDFAAARNEALSHATGDWVLWLDADDRVDERNREKLGALLAALGESSAAAYAMKCVCLPEPGEHSPTVVDHVRLFRRHPAVYWEYRVHEQLLPSLRRLGGEIRFADVAITHLGYQDPALRRRKLERDLRLVSLALAEKPDEPFCLFNLGSIYQDLGRPADALPVLRRSLERSHPADSIVSKLFARLAGCHHNLGQAAEALACCRAGRGHCPDDPELLFREALLLREGGDAAGAEGCLLRLLELPSGDHFASTDAGLRGYLALHHLALLYRAQGRDLEAETRWRQAVSENPAYLPAWRGLAEILKVRGDMVALEEVTRKLAQEQPLSARP